MNTINKNAISTQIEDHPYPVVDRNHLCLGLSNSDISTRVHHLSIKRMLCAETQPERSVFMIKDVYERELSVYANRLKFNTQHLIFGID